MFPKTLLMTSFLMLSLKRFPISVFQESLTCTKIHSYLFLIDCNSKKDIVWWEMRNEKDTLSIHVTTSIDRKRMFCNPKMSHLIVSLTSDSTNITQEVMMINLIPIQCMCKTSDFPFCKNKIKRRRANFHEKKVAISWKMATTICMPTPPILSRISRWCYYRRRKRWSWKQFLSVLLWADFFSVAVSPMLLNVF